MPAVQKTGNLLDSKKDRSRSSRGSMLNYADQRTKIRSTDQGDRQSKTINQRGIDQDIDQKRKIDGSGPGGADETSHQLYNRGMEIKHQRRRIASTDTNYSRNGDQQPPTNSIN
mmetsp:Transcript_54990/g.117354  ORF Transcript_54990/g.117354 Transcript_54990/m.117354 type:complete len:114 (+) Transcript_54990:311-652(+)